MSVADVKKNAQDKMAKSIETLRANLAKVRTGRAHTIGVQPYEKKMLGAVEKAIRDSDLGLNPSSFGEMIRVPTPPLTEERRKEMVKLCKSEAEDAKIAVRNVRRDGNEQLKKLVKDKAISEDDERRASDDIQKLTDKAVVDIDKLVAEKEKEVMTV
jgi:ribosome recycling factor